MSQPCWSFQLHCAQILQHQRYQIFPKPFIQHWLIQNKILICRLTSIFFFFFLNHNTNISHNLSKNNIKKKTSIWHIVKYIGRALRKMWQFSISYKYLCECILPYDKNNLKKISIRWQRTKVTPLYILKDTRLRINLCFTALRQWD